MGRWILISLFLGACSGGGFEEVELVLDENGIPATPEDVSEPPENAEKTESGIASRLLKKGDGTEHPNEKSKVTVHYTGWTASDGERFDSSYERKEPTSFGLGNVIDGWTEGLQLMVTGERRRFWIPEELAYKGAAGKPAGMLVFDVELISFDNPPTPPDPLTPPEDAQKTESGIQFVIVEPGTGSDKPTESDTVVFEFAGWQEDGTPIQDSFNAPRSPRAPVNKLTNSWQELIQLMVQGQKIVAWVPPGIDQLRGGPEGTVIFEFTLKELIKAPPAPDDAKNPPDDAIVTEQGVKVKVLEKGEGTEKIKGTDVVRMDFTMWTADDGKMLGSTIADGRPGTVPLQRVPMAGWSEGLQQLNKGDKARLWIPEELAFKGAEGSPKGTIVMDVHVHDILAPPKMRTNPAIPVPPPGGPGGAPAPAPAPE